uniref:MIF4G domain-containing protein n=1 Tax=viral metagenome TaxID=1070528 RepID=A0A6C0JLR2_9ZZZZ
MSLTIAQVYSVRCGAKLSLPKSVQDNIAKLRITPVAYKPFRPPPKHNSYRPRYEPKATTPENWREKSLVAYVSKLTDKGDADYFAMFGIMNKLSAANLKKLAEEGIEILRKRDQEFRLRVTNLIFDKAISEHMFAGVLADCAVIFQKEFPEIAEDFTIQAQMFTKLYDINTTLTYPQVMETDYEDKVVQWMKQKEKRRGYAKFLTQLFVRNLISEEVITACVEDVIAEMSIAAKQPKSEQTEENTTQYVDFLFESIKVLPISAKTLREIIKTALSNLLALPRPELPSLCMRSRFRMEDTLKCV